MLGRASMTFHTAVALPTPFELTPTGRPGLPSAHSTSDAGPRRSANSTEPGVRHQGFLLIGLALVVRVRRVRALAVIHLPGTVEFLFARVEPKESRVLGSLVGLSKS